jgi:site-specific DNA recombinase
MKYYSYRRVSKREKETGSASLEWQAAEIQRWCDKNGVQITDDFPDDGISAGKPLCRRPKGAELLAAVDGGDCTVVVAKADRIFRETEEFLVTWSEWARQRVDLRSANDALDRLSASGKLTATILAAVAEHERATIGERTRTRIQHRKKTGMRHCAYAPYGFRWEGVRVDEDGNKSGGELQRDDGELKWIEKMKKWQSEGWTLRRIAAELNAAGVPTRKGKPWIYSSVKKVLDTARARLSKRKRDDGRGPAAPDLTIHVEPDKEESQE